jgi:nicotinamidase-related amidase
MAKYLIVVDMQNDFVTGSLATEEAKAVAVRVAEKIRSFGGTVAFTMDTHPKGYLQMREGRALPVEHCVKGSEGWELCPEVRTLAEGKKIFEKPTFGSAEMGAWLAEENRAQAVESVEFAGLCTDVCILSNAAIARAFVPEAEILVDSSACAGTTPERHETALEALRAFQVGVL